MKSEPKLEPSLVWGDGGHLADAAVTAMIDGELALLPVEAVTHADACASCADRIGRAALLALQMADVLHARAAIEEAPQRVGLERRPLPLGALAAALAIAVIGMVPSLRGMLGLVARVAALLVHGLPVYARAFALAMSHAETRGMLVQLWMVAMAVLLLGGLCVARLVPRPMRYPGVSS
ncbi:MAG TPA: hypothetical protein VGL13_16005 [Polyangiaceae bacterium]|jgi:hypothetical protein